MQTGALTELILCEHAATIPDFGAATFVTAILPESGSHLVRCESHVFLETSGRHLHSIAFLYSECPDAPDFIRRSVIATQQLFADHRASACPLDSDDPCYRVVTLPGLPFARFQAQGILAREMTMLPDLTTSQTLRSAVESVRPATKAIDGARFPERF